MNKKLKTILCSILIFLPLTSCSNNNNNNNNNNKNKFTKYNLINYSTIFDSDNKEPILYPYDKLYDYYYLVFYKKNNKFELTYKMKDNNKISTTYGTYVKGNDDLKYYINIEETNLIINILENGEKLVLYYEFLILYFEIEK